MLLILVLLVVLCIMLSVHNDMKAMDKKDELRRQIESAPSEVKDLFNIVIDSYYYPNGWLNYSEEKRIQEIGKNMETEYCKTHSKEEYKNLMIKWRYKLAQSQAKSGINYPVGNL